MVKPLLSPERPKGKGRPEGPPLTPDPAANSSSPDVPVSAGTYTMCASVVPMKADPNAPATSYTPVIGAVKRTTAYGS